MPTVPITRLAFRACFTLFAASGSAGQQTILELDAPPYDAPGWTAEQDGFGYDVASAGDVDGDGVGDLAVAVEDRSGPLGLFAHAYVVLYSGLDRSPIRALRPPIGTTGRLVLAGIGDVDHDGHDELLVGSPADVTGGSYAGSARVYSGRTGEVLATYHGTGEDRLGSAVAGVGDLDGDGTPDFAIGLPGATVGGVAGAGRVRFYSGASGAVLPGGAAGAGAESLGSALDAAGDVNADGFPDVIAGSPGSPALASGRVRVLGTWGDMLHFKDSHANDYQGAAVAGIGDVDLDGHDDFAAGAPYHDGPVVDSGTLRIWSGKTGVLRIELSPLFEEHFGSHVARLGDVGGDGVPDVLVGAEHVGRAIVIDGATNFILHAWASTGPGRIRGADLGDLDGDGLPERAYAAAGDDTAGAGAGTVHIHRGGDGALLERMTTNFGAAFGRSVALAGDMDGDGRGEVIVGMPFQSVGGLPHAGVARIYSGDTLLFEVQGAELDQTGYAVAGLGDVTGDGVPDFAVGSPNASWFGGRGGVARLHSGATGAAVLTAGGAAWGDRCGAAVASAGDLDGDGRDDWLAGSPGTGAGAGSVRAWSAPGFLLWEASGVGGMGSSIAGTGDADQDGVPDAVVGSPRRPLFSASEVGHAALLRGTDGVQITGVSGAAVGDHLGAAVAGPGDVDLDGRADFLVGAPGAPSPAPAGGRFELRSGAGAALLGAQSGTFGERLGAAVGRVGDVTQDGVPDLAVGAPGLQHTGTARVVDGADLSTFRLFDGSKLGLEAGSGFGAALAGGGDVDGDGVPDLIAGAPRSGVPAADQAGAARALSTAAAGTTAFGAGSAGCLGPHGLSLVQPLVPGSTSALVADNLAPGVLPTLVLSLEGDLAGSDPLGWGVSLHVALPQAFAITPLPPPIGATLSAPLAVPPNPVLRGLEIFAQVGFFWPAGCPALPFKLSSSAGVAITIQ
jgi:hypothetical protein